MPKEKTLTPPVETVEEPSESTVKTEEPKEVEIPTEAPKVETEEYSDDQVIISKTELKKLQTERTNYQQGMLSAKEALKETKITSEKKEGDYLTKKDFFKSNEKVAIENACKDEKTEKNWDAIVAYYSSRRGMNTVDAIKQDIQDAVYLWEKNNPQGDVEDKEATSKQATEEAKPTGATTGKGKETKKRIILKENIPIKDWYPKPDEKE